MHCNNYNHLRLKLPNGFRLTVLCFIDMYLLSPRSADTSFPYSEPPLNPIKQASSISVEAFLYLISTLKSTVYCNCSRVQGSKQLNPPRTNLAITATPSAKSDNFCHVVCSFCHKISGLNAFQLAHSIKIIILFSNYPIRPNYCI